MKSFFLSFVFFVIFVSCNNDSSEEFQPVSKNNAIFLHHSTGNNIWNGGVKKWIKEYNENYNTSYVINEQNFPQEKPYGWKNNPYDYYNIWVKNAGNNFYLNEPTLEILTKDYNLIIWKHCYITSGINSDKGTPDINSDIRRLENYKLQYLALKEKMHQFPNIKFLVWTGAANVKNKTNEEKAKRMLKFVNWVKNEWDEENDNIFIWDFYKLETEGELYLKNEYAVSKDNSHPNEFFSKKVAPLFGKRIIEVFNK